MSTRFTVFATIFLLNTSACAQEAPESLDLACMTATHVTSRAKNRNVLILCRGPEYATLSISFENKPLFEPTVCSSVGPVELVDRTTSIYKFGNGQCDNGRTLKPTELKCTSTIRGQTCLYQGTALKFAPVRVRP